MPVNKEIHDSHLRYIVIDKPKDLVIPFLLYLERWVDRWPVVSSKLLISISLRPGSDMI